MLSGQATQQSRLAWPNGIVNLLVISFWIQHELLVIVAMLSVEDLLLAAALVVVGGGAVERPRLPWRFWVHSSLKSCNRYSATAHDVDPLNLEYRVDAGFSNCFRMTATDFEILLRKIGPQIKKENTRLRQAIPAQEQSSPQEILIIH